MSSLTISHGKTVRLQRSLYPNKVSYLLKTPLWKQTRSFLFLRNQANVAHVLFQMGEQETNPLHFLSPNLDAPKSSCKGWMNIYS